MKHISILRGINVSGQKKIKMADLKALYESLGFENVITYIQSGNVIFDSPEKSAKKLVVLIEKKITEIYDFEVPVLVISPSYLKKINKANPFYKKKTEEVKLLYFTFLAEIPKKENISRLTDIEYKSDEIILKEKEKIVYIFVPGGYGKTKFSNNLIENKLKVKATTRNWKTVNKLIELSNS